MLSDDGKTTTVHVSNLLETMQILEKRARALTDRAAAETDARRAAHQSGVAAGIREAMTELRDVLGLGR